MSEKERRYVPEQPPDKININGYDLNEEEIKRTKISIALNSLIQSAFLSPYVQSNGKVGGKTDEKKWLGKTLIEILVMLQKRVKDLELAANRGMVKLTSWVQDEKNLISQIKDLFDSHPDTQALIFCDSTKTNPILDFDSVKPSQFTKENKNGEGIKLNEGVGLYRFAYPNESIKIIKTYTKDGNKTELEVEVSKLDSAEIEPGSSQDIKLKIIDISNDKNNDKTETLSDREYTCPQKVFYANRGTIPGEFSATLRDIVLGNYEPDDDLFKGPIYEGEEARGFLEYKGLTGQDQYAFDAFYHISDYSNNEGKKYGLPEDMAIKYKFKPVSDENAEEINITGFSQGGHKALYIFFKQFLLFRASVIYKKGAFDVSDLKEFIKKHNCLQVNSPGLSKDSWDCLINKIGNENYFKELCKSIISARADNDIISPLDQKNLYKSIFFEGGGHTCSKININNISDYKPSYIFYGEFLKRILEFVGARHEKNPDERFSKTSFAAFDRFFNGTTKNVFGDEIKFEFGWTFYSLLILAWCFVAAWFATFKIRVKRAKLFMDIKTDKEKKLKSQNNTQTLDDQEKQFFTEEYKEIKKQVNEAVKSFFDSYNEDDLKDLFETHSNLERQVVMEVKKGVFAKLRRLENSYNRTQPMANRKNIEDVVHALDVFINLFIKDEYKERLKKALDDVEPNIFGIAWQTMKNIFRLKPKWLKNSAVDRKCYNIFKALEKVFDPNKTKSENYDNFRYDNRWF